MPEASLRRHVPAELELDTHDGSAWLGLSFFRVGGLRLRGTLPVPRLSTFQQLTVRTYVSRGRRPGVWILGLDATSAAAVEAARRLYRLPASRARIDVRPEGDGFVVECARAGEHGRAFSACYTPAGEPTEPRRGSLEHFLTERYCVYAAAGGTLHRADVHHEPWRLQPAEAEIALNTMPPADVELGASEPLLHFSRRHDVLTWPLVPIAGRAA